jgi:hypothetical protein
MGPDTRSGIERDHDGQRQARAGQDEPEDIVLGADEGLAQDAQGPGVPLHERHRLLRRLSAGVAGGGRGEEPQRATYVTMSRRTTAAPRPAASGTQTSGLEGARDCSAPAPPNTSTAVSADRQSEGRSSARRGSAPASTGSTESRRRMVAAAIPAGTAKATRQRPGWASASATAGPATAEPKRTKLPMPAESGRRRGPKPVRRGAAPPR